MPDLEQLKNKCSDDAFSVYINEVEKSFWNKNIYAYVLWLYYCQNKLLLIAC